MLKFSLKPKEKLIRVLSAPGVKWLTKPMPGTDGTELAKKFEEYDPRMRSYHVVDSMGLLKAQAARVVRGWENLPGDELDEDGKPIPIPFTAANLEAMCEMNPGVITEVIIESGRADALEVEAAEKNS